MSHAALDGARAAVQAAVGGDAPLGRHPDAGAGQVEVRFRAPGLDAHDGLTVAGRRLVLPGERQPLAHRSPAPLAACERAPFAALRTDVDVGAGVALVGRCPLAAVLVAVLGPPGPRTPAAVFGRRERDTAPRFAVGLPSLLAGSREAVRDELAVEAGGVPLGAGLDLDSAVVPLPVLRPLA